MRAAWVVRLRVVMCTLQITVLHLGVTHGMVAAGAEESRVLRRHGLLIQHCRLHFVAGGAVRK